jgi:TRAP-type C4-dicarboxylate transport system permease small subunit
MSLCEEHFKAQQVGDKDIDLMKIQIYADKCHTVFTIGCSLGFVALGFWGIFATVYYQGWSSFKISDIYVGWIGMTAMLMLTVFTLGVFRIRYDRGHSRISKMIEAVKKGEQLPAFDKLNKWDC